MVPPSEEECRPPRPRTARFLRGNAQLPYDPPQLSERVASQVHSERRKNWGPRGPESGTRQTRSRCLSTSAARHLDLAPPLPVALGVKRPCVFLLCAKLR